MTTPSTRQLVGKDKLGTGPTNRSTSPQRLALDGLGHRTEWDGLVQRQHSLDFVDLLFVRCAQFLH